MIFEKKIRIQDMVITAVMAISAFSAIITTLGIVFSVIFESYQFFSGYNILEFLFGTHWSPQSSTVEHPEGVFGIIPLLVGTLLITAIALCVAVPLGLGSAVFLSEFASKRTRQIIKPVTEILAGIPSVVYGFLAVLLVSPMFRRAGENFGFEISSDSALAAGLVMGIMIIPFMSSLSDDAMHSVPQSLRDGSNALGATKSETVIKVVLPTAFPGIIAATILSFSRAIGETMIVVMAAGLSANLSVNPLEAVTTITVQIVTVLVGDQEFDSLKTMSAFALGLFLFTLTLILNIYALKILKKYKEDYE